MTNMQTLMNQAYARWQALEHQQWSQEDFWDQLDSKERFAVFLGNLNHQVQNGGFLQWWSNGYATPETFGYIKRACNRIGTDSAKQVGNMVTCAEDICEEYNAGEVSWRDMNDTFSSLDPIFYAICDQFIADAEAYLTQQQ
jgi:hypothetical protein